MDCLGLLFGFGLLPENRWKISSSSSTGEGFPSLKKQLAVEAGNSSPFLQLVPGALPSWVQGSTLAKQLRLRVTYE